MRACLTLAARQPALRSMQSRAFSTSRAVLRARNKKGDRKSSFTPEVQDAARRGLLRERAVHQEIEKNIEQMYSTEDPKRQTRINADLAYLHARAGMFAVGRRFIMIDMPSNTTAAMAYTNKNRNAIEARLGEVEEAMDKVISCKLASIKPTVFAPMGEVGIVDRIVRLFSAGSAISIWPIVRFSARIGVRCLRIAHPK